MPFFKTILLSFYFRIDPETHFSLLAASTSLHNFGNIFLIVDLNEFHINKLVGHMFETANQNLKTDRNKKDKKTVYS